MTVKISKYDLSLFSEFNLTGLPEKTADKLVVLSQTFAAIPVHHWMEMIWTLSELSKEQSEYSVGLLMHVAIMVCHEKRKALAKLAVAQALRHANQFGLTSEDVDLTL